MQINEFNRPLTAKTLNENMGKMFGQKLDLNKFNLEQLEDARNKIRTKVSQVESGGFSAVHENEEYTKHKMFLDVLNRAIDERRTVVSDLTQMEQMVLQKVEEGSISFDELPEELQAKVNFRKEKEQAAEVVESVLREGEEEKAELIMAARDMVDRITGWMEDTANMQAESMLELVDSIRDELGSDVSMEFEGVVKPALAAIYTAMETSRQQLTQGVGLLTGEGGPETPMGAPEAGAEEEVPAEAPEGEEEAAASAPAAGGEEEAGRAIRESVKYSRRLASLLAPK